MKTRSLCSLAIVTLTIGTLGLQSSRADDIRATPQIQVTGTASKKLTPDRMAWSLQVQNKGKELEQVAEEHLQYAAALLTFLKEQGIPAKMIQTSQMEFGENMVYRDRERVKDGYIATTKVNFTLEDFGLYQKIWKGAAKLGNVSIKNVDYLVDDREAAQNELKISAMKDAQKKAKALAAAVGSRIGSAIRISEGRQSGISQLPRLSEDSFAAVSAPATSPGQLEISSSVNVTFKLIK